MFKKYYALIVIFGLIIGGVWFLELTGITGPNCDKVHPQGLAIKSNIIKYYEKMIIELNANDYSSAYETYQLLNSANNQIDNLMATDNNYDCFLDANYSDSTYEWFQKYPGNAYGGELKTPCLLWGMGCTTTKPRFSNPCDEYEFSEDYIDCIEDNARPDPNYDPY